MNKNYFSNGIMRRMRQHTHDMTANFHSKDKDIERLKKLKNDDEITQTVYDREVSAIHEKIKSQTIKLKEDTKKDLMTALKEMRQIAGNQIVKPPTPEMVSTLQLLSMLEEISPVQLTLYAEQMADCPLAMQRLQQIAKTHEQRIWVDDPETKLRALDVLEGNLVNYLANYDGDISHASFSVRQMYPYFQPDDQYMGNPKTLVDTEKVNQKFWNEMVGLSSPDVFDDPDGRKKGPKAQYFFSDVKALATFIKKATANLEGPMVETTVNTILENCPERYGAIYRAYKANGEIIDLNDPEIKI